MSALAILLRWQRGLAHDHVSVFIGPDQDHLALSGTLAMRPEESEVFRAAVLPGLPGIEVMERGWYVPEAWPERVAREGDGG